MYPAEYLYSKDHEWILIEGDIGIVGFTDCALREMGNAVRVELPEMEDSVEAGEPCGAVEFEKAVSEIFSPVSGEIMEINVRLAVQPELLTQSPHKDAWLIRIRLEHPEEMKELLSAEAYEEYLQ